MKNLLKFFALLLLCFTLACQESSTKKEKQSEANKLMNDTSLDESNDITESEAISENAAFFKIDKGAKYPACYLLYTKQANALMKDKNFEESLALLKKAESIQSEIRALDAFSMATNYVRLEKNEQAVVYFKQALEKGVKWNRLAKAKNLADFRTKDVWKALEKEGPTITKNYVSQLDTTLRKQLLEMSINVRQIRKESCNQNKKKKRRKCPELAEADSVHAVTVLTYTREKGFPATDQIGLDGMASYLEFIRKGLRKGIIDWKEIKPFFEKAIFSGNLDPSVYAQMEDMYRVVISKRPQLYGNHNKMGNKKQKSQSRFNPILRVEEVDQRRLSLGLPTLKDYALQAKIKPMPMGYVELGDPMEFLGCD